MQYPEGMKQQCQRFHLQFEPNRRLRGSTSLVLVGGSAEANPQSVRKNPAAAAAARIKQIPKNKLLAGVDRMEEGNKKKKRNGSFLGAWVGEGDRVQSSPAE